MNAERKSDREPLAENNYEDNSDNLNSRSKLSLASDQRTGEDCRTEEDSLPSFLFDLDDVSEDQLNNLITMLHTASAYSSHALPQHHAQHPHQHSHVHPHHNHRLVNGTATPPYGGVNSAFYRQSSGTSAFYHTQHPGTYHHHHPHAHSHHAPTSHQVSKFYIFSIDFPMNLPINS